MSNNTTRTIFISGASRGIGRAIALAFAREGANIAINCVNNLNALNETAAQIEKLGGSVMPVFADMSDYMSASRAVSAVMEYFGEIDVLINNAGVAYTGLFNLMEPNEWQRVIDVNIGAALNLTRNILPSMLARHDGVIINISSIWGITGASCEVVYSLTKGALNTFTRALAKEVAPNGIRVNAIACGVIDTDMNGFLTDDEQRSLIEQIPMSRMGGPNEAAELALFLAGPEAGYITGQVIVLDGGMI